MPALPAMPPVSLPDDEFLHPTSKHEWWYFFADLVQPATGVRYHYTSCLMRKGIGFLSYARFWREGSAPTTVSAVHRRPRVPPNTQELVIRPQEAHWSVTLGPGLYVHELARFARLRFRDTTEGACLHTSAAEGGICRYGGDLEMAWYSWPRLDVRGRLAGVRGDEGVLTGRGWMEHQWGNTDFTKLHWRYVPMLLDDGRRLVAYRFEHEDHPSAARFEVASLHGGAAHGLAAATMTPDRGTTLETVITFGGESVRAVSLEDGRIELVGYPFVPAFFEGPTRLYAGADPTKPVGIGISEFHPL